jgi:hypothetical protein
MTKPPPNAEVDLEPGADHWEIRFRGRYSAGDLLRELARLLPPGLTLYLEGTSISPIAAAFLAARPAEHPMAVRRGVIWPRPTSFHLPLTADNVAGLTELMDHLAAPEVGDHVHAYEGTTAHLIWHDAWFDSPLYLRRTVPIEAVQHLCDAFNGEVSAVTA